MNPVNPAAFSGLAGMGLGLGGMGLASMGGVPMSAMNGGLASAAVAQSDVLMVTNLPPSILESQVRELVATFGEVSNAGLLSSL